jgi:polyphosphate kinase
MPRNLNRRIEVACPVYDETIKEELKEMLMIQLKDNTKARILDPQLTNQYNIKNRDFKYRAQEDYYNYIKSKHHIVMKIFHNPHCAQSREGLRYLEKKGYEIEVKKYMADGISEEELREIIYRSGRQPVDFVRTQEREYREIYKDLELSDEEWIKVLTENPKLLQRPIVVNGNKSVLAIPPAEIDKII